MSDRSIILITLFLAGVLSFTLLGGWSEYGDHSVLPWAVGLFMLVCVALFIDAGKQTRRRD